MKNRIPGSGQCSSNKRLPGQGLQAPAGQRVPRDVLSAEISALMSSGPAEHRTRARHSHAALVSSADKFDALWQNGTGWRPWLRFYAGYSCGSVNRMTTTRTVLAADMDSAHRYDQIFVTDKNSPRQVNGHTDGIGGDQFNLDLSQRRAAAVKNTLVEQYKIKPARLATAGYGKSQPKETNDTLEGRAHNRRVRLMRIG